MRIDKYSRTLCEPCDIDCPVGSGLSHDCDNSFPYNISEVITCINCSDGYFSKHNKCEKCHPKCAVNETETKSCMLDQDRICSCKSGLYRDSETSSCIWKCSQCETNQKEHYVPNHECNDRPRHMVCYNELGFFSHEYTSAFMLKSVCL